MPNGRSSRWRSGILLVVFGALLAALLPVLLALTAFLAANGLLALVSHVLHVDTSASSVMLLMGMAVGVDYCLFYLRRDREERARGATCEAALRIAAATSGRSVLVSGLTVIVAMAGMFLSGMQLFDGFAIATISVVLIAVVGLGDRAARAAVAARRQGRVRARAVPGPDPTVGGRQPGLEGRARPRAGAPGAVRCPGGRLPARPRRTGAQHAHRAAERAADAAGQHADRAGATTTSWRRSPAGRRPRSSWSRHPTSGRQRPGRQIAALASYRSSALGQPIEVTVYPGREHGGDPGPPGGERDRRHLAARAGHTARHDRAGDRREDPRRRGARRRQPRDVARLQQPCCGTASCRSSCSSWPSRSC